MATEAKQAKRIEAKNFVSYRWAPDETKGASGATGYEGPVGPVAGFVFGKESVEQRRLWPG